MCLENSSHQLRQKGYAQVHCGTSAQKGKTCESNPERRGRVNFLNLEGGKAGEGGYFRTKQAKHPKDYSSNLAF